MWVRRSGLDLLAQTPVLVAVVTIAVDVRMRTALVGVAVSRPYEQVRDEVGRREQSSE